MSFDNGFYDPAVEAQSETTNTEQEEEESVEEMSDEELIEMIQDRDNVEQIPEDACSRWEVCGNTCMGTTCPDCWDDIRKQLTTPDSGCNECDNQYFKYLPAGEDVGIRCKECGWVEWQAIEYTGDVEKSDWEKARESLDN